MGIRPIVLSTLAVARGRRVRAFGKSVAKQLAKLKLTGNAHQCIVTYDNDSRVIASNGDFYAVFKLSKCDQ